MILFSQLVSVLLVIAFLEEGAKNAPPGVERPDPIRCCAVVLGIQHLVTGVLPMFSLSSSR